MRGIGRDSEFRGRLVILAMKCEPRELGKVGGGNSDS